MNILIINIIMIVSYALFTKVLPTNDHTKRSIYLAVSSLHIIFLYIFYDQSAFPDLEGYYLYYDEYFNSQEAITSYLQNIGSTFEDGWLLLNMILRIITKNERAIQVTASLIIVFCYSITIKRYSIILWLSLILYMCSLFYGSLFILRQHLAVAICFFSSTYVLDRKLLKFVLATMIAFSFHSSALVWLIVYPLYSKKVDIKFYMLTALGTIALWVFMDSILEGIVPYTSKILAYTAVSESGGSGSIKISIVNLSALALSHYVFRDGSINGVNKLAHQLISVALFLNILSFIGTSFILFSRLTIYFSAGSIILIPNSLARITNKALYYILITGVIISYLLLLESSVQYGFALKY